VIREQETTIDGNPFNFQGYAPDKPRRFSRDLKQFSLYGVWALLDNRPGVASNCPDLTCCLDRPKGKRPTRTE